ncbi:MAG: CPBP family intramembrane metalloprotease [Flavobacteriaceae bacterium]|nr:CPBP family intramembrane metalloprotease [Flavobacteriaceae bacterium]
MKSEFKGWQRVLIIILPYFFIVAIFQLIGAIIAGVDISNREAQNSSGQTLIMTIFGLLGTLFVLWLFMKKIDKEDFINLGFQTKDRVKEFFVGIGLGALIMVLGYFILIFLNQIHFQKLIFNPKEILLSILVFTVVAIMEESLVRGYILRNFMNSFNKYVALIITSLIFSLMHAANPNVDLFSLINLFIAGLLLGISYIYTKNLWFPIGLHLGWNLFQTLLGFNVSGQDFYSLVVHSISENNILNGGTFGFEGSILSIIAEVICVIGIAYYYNIKTKLIDG